MNWLNNSKQNEKLKTSSRLCNVYKGHILDFRFENTNNLKEKNRKKMLHKQQPQKNGATILISDFKYTLK